MKREENKYFRSATIINEGRREVKNIVVEGSRITKISDLPIGDLPKHTKIIDCEHYLLLPGVIDAHVHFRQPGLEYKADMASESRAALAGGVTSVLDMPNTNPPTTNISALKNKIRQAQNSMLCNFGFFFGVTKSNMDEVLSLENNSLACGLKIYLGSSTGNLLLEDKNSLERLFSGTPLIISAHCEDEKRIRERTETYRNLYNKEVVPADLHCLIRDNKACFDSSSYTISLAKKHNTRLHIAHLTTKEEINLFSCGDIVHKRITSEVSPSHLWFSSEDYADKHNLIKCNPAIKSKEDKEALRTALANNKIDIVATDHAPHLLEEKLKSYFEAPSGIPSIQHSLLVMLELVKQGVITLETMVEKMSHNPAKLFGIKQRGFIREGFFADIVLISLAEQTLVKPESIFYKCKWSPLLATTFSNRIIQTYVNGNLAFDRGKITTDSCGMLIDQSI